MRTSNQPQSQQSDDRLSAFISNFAESGDSMIHMAVKRGFSKGRHVEILQELFDQYIHSSMYDCFNEDQRKEFEFLVAKYKLVRSEAYTRSISFD